MQISAAQVKQLREQTGVGMMECKAALAEAQGNLEQAVTILRKRGLAAAEKKAGRRTAEGAVTSYIHAGGKIGVLVEINCETDFVAKTDDFKALAKDLALHVAASNPRFVDREEVTAEVLAKESQIFAEQAKASGKPENVVKKIVDGKMEKFYQEVCLMEQPFVKEPDRKVRDLVHDAVAKLGENIQVGRFARFKLGEEPDANHAGQGAAVGD